jgi:hypothetical protein
MGDCKVGGDGGEGDGDGSGGDDIDGDGSGGTSPSRQGAGTETSVPRNWSSMAAALWNFTGENADCFRVFRRKALYRRRGGVRGGPGPPHHTAGWARGRATLGCGCPLAPLRLSFGLRPSCGKNRSFGFLFCPIPRIFPV